VGEDPVQLVYDLADYIGHFHLADIAQNKIHNHLIPGEGVIDFKRVLKAIYDIGYDGYITVELYPYQKDPIRAARKAHDYLIDIMN
jgi:sugar phosphate isomerase/epimerase